MILAGLIALISMFLTLTALALVHEKVPDRNIYGPLPDVVLDNIPALDWALDVSEYLIIVCANSAFLFILCHKYR